MNLDGELEALMVRYQEGDFAAATALIHRLSPRIRRFFALQFSSRTSADDLLQDTWLRIHEVRHTYRPGEPVLPWLYAIARHIRVDHYRKAGSKSAREQSLDETPDIAAPTASPAAAVPMADLLAPLPASRRDVVVMLKISGMSLDAVARATSSSIGAVKQKAFRAYEKLRERLAQKGGSS